MKRIYLISVFALLTFISANAQWGIQQCMQKHRITSPLKMHAPMPTGYDLTHYDLHIDTISFNPKQIEARAGVTFLSTTAPISSVTLDLLKFSIDSVFAPNYTVTRSYNDTLLSIQFTPAVTTGDSVLVWIHYHGEPQQDASGWGGFYFSQNFAFNLGVGFMADPHNFGRAWFPCQDNFTSRSRYDFHITTAAGSMAFCNGTLQQAVTNPNGTITWHWKQQQTIPGYLASMAVGPYHSLERTSNGLPVQWAAQPVDTNAVLATFSNLDTTLAAYINAYGAYPFDKVGYCLVPFNSGAMEHAASIHIGRAFVNGTQNYATLWAHELAHMWWGDKVTCETAEDMWLNEGFASYNEAFYKQNVDGITAYRDWIRTNHRKVLQFAHTPAQDGSYLTMNQIPHAYTYGFHVYQKGADVVHTLRHYMGDQEFFNGCQYYMNNRAYSHANSANLRDDLTAGSGVNMNRFFDDWIFTPGFPHFSIDSVIHVPGGLDHMFVYVRQRSKGNNHLYEMPVDITFTDGLIDTTVRVLMDSATKMFHIPLFMVPEMTILDRYGKVSDARVSNEKIITVTGSQVVAETNLTLNVQTVGLPGSLVRIEHNFVPPDPFLSSNPGIRLSDYRYWKVDGIFKSGMHTKAFFIYDGSTSGSTGYLDNTLISGTEDSLVILYRPGAGYDWTPVSNYTININTNPNDKRGTITVDTLKKGEYTLGYFDYTVGITEAIMAPANVLTVAPNPSGDQFVFTLPKELKNHSGLVIYDLGGRKIFETPIETGADTLIWNCSQQKPGTYLATLIEEGIITAVVKIVVGR